MKNIFNKRDWAIAARLLCFTVLYALLLYACGAILQSCSMYRQTDINGKATIVTTDTTYINHNTLLKYQKK